VECDASVGSICTQMLASARIAGAQTPASTRTTGALQWSVRRDQKHSPGSDMPTASSDSTTDEYLPAAGSGASDMVPSPACDKLVEEHLLASCSAADNVVASASWDDTEEEQFREQYGVARNVMLASCDGDVWAHPSPPRCTPDRRGFARSARETTLAGRPIVEVGTQGQSQSRGSPCSFFPVSGVDTSADSVRTGVSLPASGHLPASLCLDHTDETRRRSPGRFARLGAVLGMSWSTSLEVSSSSDSYTLQ